MIKMNIKEKNLYAQTLKFKARNLDHHKIDKNKNRRVILHKENIHQKQDQLKKFNL